jgi:hypothetical protein
MADVCFGISTKFKVPQPSYPVGDIEKEITIFQYLVVKGKVLVGKPQGYSRE